MAGAVSDCSLVLAWSDGRNPDFRPGASLRRKLAGSVGRSVAGGIYAAARNLPVAVVRNPLLCRADTSGVLPDCPDSPLPGPLLQPRPGGQVAHGVLSVGSALDSAAGYVPAALCVFDRIQPLGLSAPQSGLPLAPFADRCDHGGSGGWNGMACNPKMAMAVFRFRARWKRSGFLLPQGPVCKEKRAAADWPDPPYDGLDLDFQRSAGG